MAKKKTEAAEVAELMPLRLEWRDPGELSPNPANWRTHPANQIASLQSAMAEVGWAGALLYNERTGRLIDGHARQELFAGKGKVPVLVGSWDEATERKILATLDPLAGLAEADTAKLAELLAGVDTSSEALQAMLDELAEDSGLTETPAEVVEDEVPAAPVEPITKPGDLWILGEHRLLCGDSTKAEDVGRLMDGGRINLAFTSPPYASQREYDESSGFKPIPPDDYVEWWEPIQNNVKAHIAPDGSFFVNIKPCADGLDTHLYVMDLVIAHVRRWGWHFATEFCWERTGVPKGVTRRFKNQFEPIYQFAVGEWKMRPESVRHSSSDVPMSLGKGSGNTGWADRQGKGGVIASNRRPRREGKTSTKSLGEMQVTGCDVGEVVVNGMAFPGNRLPPFTGSHEALGHAAAFPVGLPAFFMNAYTDKGDTVYEPFSGSGSTLIAAEQLGRKCRAMEISPQYCDVAVQRWEKLTGKKATVQRG